MCMGVERLCEEAQGRRGGGAVLRWTRVGPGCGAIRWWGLAVPGPSFLALGLGGRIIFTAAAPGKGWVWLAGGARKPEQHRQEKNDGDGEKNSNRKAHGLPHRCATNIISVPSTSGHPADGL